MCVYIPSRVNFVYTNRQSFSLGTFIIQNLSFYLPSAVFSIFVASYNFKKEKNVFFRIIFLGRLIGKGYKIILKSYLPFRFHFFYYVKA